MTKSNSDFNERAFYQMLEQAVAADEQTAIKLMLELLEELGVVKTASCMAEAETNILQSIPVYTENVMNNLRRRLIDFMHKENITDEKTGLNVQTGNMEYTVSLTVVRTK